MFTERKPWFRASKNAWFVTFNGKQVRLAKGEENHDEAMTVFYKLLANEETPSSNKIRVIQLADLFLSWSELHHTPSTFRWHKIFLDKFCKFKGTGKLLVADMKPFHLTRFLDNQKG